jgi:hypothetical protein
MFSFLDNWWTTFYPESWVDNPGIVITLFVVSILCLVGLRWATKQIRNMRTNRRWKLWFAVGIWITFLWTLPALIIGVISIVLSILVLVIIGLVFWAIMSIFFGGEEGENIKNKYIIKKEDGKEVAYEKGFLGDRKIGELHSNLLGGSKETRNITGPNIRVAKENAFSTERAGEIGGEKGVFKKGFFDNNPTFYPEEKSEEE